MALTPQMRHSILLLGMSTKDLNEYVDAAVEANPFLQKALAAKKSKIRRPEYSGTEAEISEKKDPRALLLSQVRLNDLDDKELEITEYLIYEMDDNGYISADIDEAAQDLSVTSEQVEACLSLIQNLDPPGIGARDIKECLQLQLKRINKEDSLEYIIVSEFIEEIAKSNADKIAKALKIDKEKVNAAIAAIKKLNPRPAGNLLSDKAHWISPDLIVSFKGKKVRIELNREWMPSLRIYNPYEDKLSVVKDPKAREFMKENVEAAKHLVDGLNRREETICKVADYILNFHKDSLKDGGHAMNSLMINDIAAALNLHPSTINRAISNKYIQIENKVITLKSLLSSKVKKADGESVSKISVKKQIEMLIKNEDKSHPLSDKAIQEIFAVDEGIMIQRRTITKYRDSLKILPTYLRKNK